MAEQVPVVVKEKVKKPRTKSTKAKAAKTSENEAAALLVRLQLDGQVSAVPPIQLNGKEIVIGTDSVLLT